MKEEEVQPREHPLPDGPRGYEYQVIDEVSSVSNTEEYTSLSLSQENERAIKSLCHKVNSMYDLPKDKLGI